MVTRIFTLFILLTAFAQGSFAQSKEDRKAAKRLQSDITFLASDELEGRRTSTEGERKAADYIEKRYKEIKISPYKNQYRYPFHFIYGKEMASSTRITISNVNVPLNDDAFALPFSANKHVKSEILPDVMEQGSIWMEETFHQVMMIAAIPSI